MKKIILAAIVFATSWVSAQELSFGVKGGINIAKLNGQIPSELDYNKAIIGPHIGGFINYEIQDQFSVQAELNFSRQGTTIGLEEAYDGDVISFKQKLRATYLNIPLLAKYEISPGINAFVGPQIGFTLKAVSKWELESELYPEENIYLDIDLINGGTYDLDGDEIKTIGGYKQIDFSLVFGGSYELTSNLFVDARYNLGLSIVDKYSTYNTSYDSFQLKNSVFQCSLGYQF